MKIDIVKATVSDIQHLRSLFLQERNFQFIHNAFHQRGWSDCYALSAGDNVVGYGATCGRGNWATERSTIFEFYIIPSFRQSANSFFSALLQVSGVSFIECQTNDLLLANMLYEYGENIQCNTILFEDRIVTGYSIPGAIFRLRREGEPVFEHTVEGAGEYVLEVNGEVVATGGFLIHYNPPWSDLYMEVKPDCRRKGYGSYILQEIKKESYKAGRKPAARCNVVNTVSKMTLLKAGLQICGYGLTAGTRPATDTVNSNPGYARFST